MCSATLEWAVVVLVFLLFSCLPLISSGNKEATKSLTGSCEEQVDMSGWGVNVMQLRDWHVSKKLPHRLILLVNYVSWGCYCKGHENQSTIVKCGMNASAIARVWLLNIVTSSNGCQSWEVPNFSTEVYSTDFVLAWQHKQVNRRYWGNVCLNN